MDKITRIPAIPLVTHDPMFSIWQTSDLPSGEDTSHWTGVRKRLRGSATIDGVQYRFLGRAVGRTMTLTQTCVTPLSTQYTFQADGVQLVVRFTSPLLLDDLDILSTPISYICVDATSLDGRDHDISVSFSLFADICHSGEYEPDMRWDFFTEDGLNYGYMGQVRQKPLCGSGDLMTCDWGYVFLASEDEIYDPPETMSVMLRYQKKACGELHGLLLIGYDEVASINYFGRLLPSYYARNGKTITQALREFYDRREELLARCDRFDEQLRSEARAKGG